MIAQTAIQNSTGIRRISSRKLTVKRNITPFAKSEGSSASSSSLSTAIKDINVEDIVQKVKDAYDGIDDKQTVFLYGGGALIALWISSTLIGAINSLPVIPKVFELVGLGYTTWFVYRYVLFKSNREELSKEVDTVKSKIQGET